MTDMEPPGARADSRNWTAPPGPRATPLHRDGRDAYRRSATLTIVRAGIVVGDSWPGAACCHPAALQPAAASRCSRSGLGVVVLRVCRLLRWSCGSFASRVGPL